MAQLWGRRGAHLIANKSAKSECKKFSTNKNVKKGTGFTRQNDPLLTRRDNGFYDEGGHYLIFKCKLKR